LQALPVALRSSAEVTVEYFQKSSTTVKLDISAPGSLESLKSALLDLHCPSVAGCKVTAEVSASRRRRLAVRMSAVSDVKVTVEKPIDPASSQPPHVTVSPSETANAVAAALGVQETEIEVAPIQETVVSEVVVVVEKAAFETAGTEASAGDGFGASLAASVDVSKVVEGVAVAAHIEADSVSSSEPAVEAPKAPTVAPTEGACEDTTDGVWFWRCMSSNSKRCAKKSYQKRCPKACNSCPTCEDSVKGNWANKCKNSNSKKCSRKRYQKNCPLTCGQC